MNPQGQSLQPKEQQIDFFLCPWSRLHKSVSFSCLPTYLHPPGCPSNNKSNWNGLFIHEAHTSIIHYVTNCSFQFWLSCRTSCNRIMHCLVSLVGGHRRQSGYFVSWCHTYVRSNHYAQGVYIRRKLSESSGGKILSWIDFLGCGAGNGCRQREGGGGLFMKLGNFM